MRNISEDRHLNVTELVILVCILQDYELTMPEKWDTPEIFGVTLLYSTTCSITEKDSWIKLYILLTVRLVMIIYQEDE